VNVVQSKRFHSFTERNEISLKLKDVLQKIFSKIWWNFIQVPDKIFLILSIFHGTDES
jgi:hypothetical protein